MIGDAIPVADIRVHEMAGRSALFLYNQNINIVAGYRDSTSTLAIRIHIRGDTTDLPTFIS